MLVENETNNSTNAEMENQYRTEKEDDAKKIRKSCKKQRNIL